LGSVRRSMNRFILMLFPHLLCGGFSKRKPKMPSDWSKFYRGKKMYLHSEADAPKSREIYSWGERATNLMPVSLVEALKQMNEGNTARQKTENAFHTAFLYSVIWLSWEAFWQLPRCVFDFEILREKVQTKGAEYIVTQMFFEQCQSFSNLGRRCSSCGN